MKTLIWREYRLNLLSVIAGASLLLIPYLFTAVAIFGLSKESMSWHEIAQHFGFAAVMSCWLSQLMVAFLGGNAFAGERADRSAEFMAYLPISRERRLASKLILSAAIIGVIWAINMVVIAILAEYRPGDLIEAFGLTAATGVVLFGVAWLISALQSSPTFAVCGGLATPMVTWMGLWMMYSLAENIAPEAVQSLDYYRTILNSYIVISLVLGTLGFIIGMRYFLKRVEP
jgi:ABC-type transport system involved in multi-copper enzyme maturation permease subunit